MVDVIVRMQVRASPTGSRGVDDIAQTAYSPMIAETNGAFQEDPFFRVSPAIALGDGYLSEALASEKIVPAPAPNKNE